MKSLRIVLLLFLMVSVHQANSVVANTVTVSLNDDNKFVLSGQERLAGLNLESASSSLLPADEPDPFQFTLRNGPANVVFGILGDEVILDGQVTLQAGWDPQSTARDLVATYGVLTSEVPLDAIIVGTILGGIPDISIADDGRLKINEPLSDTLLVSITSAAGSLNPVSAVPGFNVQDASPNRVVFRPASPLAGESVLPLSWNFGDPDLLVSFTTETGTAFGPFEFPENAYPPAPVPEPAAPLALVLGSFLLARRRRG